jgi:hypothetical protein
MTIRYINQQGEKNNEEERRKKLQKEERNKRYGMREVL